LVIATGAVVLAGTLALAAASQDTKKKLPTPPAPSVPPVPPVGDAPPMQLPPGWTPEDMQAMMESAMPGPMHAWMAKHAGRWNGKTTMWMAPETEPMHATGVATTTMIMDGRYAQTDFVGELPGMGQMKGLGIVGFDNVSQKFVGTWIDSFGTGIMNGVGELSSDGTKLTWTYTANCPITKKPVKVRQVESFPDANTMILEMWGVDPHSGKEFKSLQVDYTRAMGSN